MDVALQFSAQGKDQRKDNKMYNVLLYLKMTNIHLFTHSIISWVYFEVNIWDTVCYLYQVYVVSLERDYKSTTGIVWVSDIGLKIYKTSHVYCMCDFYSV